MNTYNWCIPCEYPLETTEQCVDLLERGYTLINNAGFTVYKVHGIQIRNNIKRTRDYKFSKPCLWQVLDTSKKEVIAIRNPKSLWFLIESFLLWINLKLFQ